MIHRSTRRLLLLIPAVLAGLWPAAPSLAQTTIRLEPEVVLFEVTPSTIRTRVDVSIFLDNIPPPGLGSFDIVLDARPGGLDGPPCVQLNITEVEELDPDLEAAWGTHTDFAQGIGDRARARWFARAFTPFTGPTGTVRLGRLRYVVSPGNFPEGCTGVMQDNFEWIRSQTTWGTGSVPNRAFESYQGSPWVIGRPLDVELETACDVTSPADPNVFVDGDFITVSCQVTNQGSETTQLLPTLISVLSKDTTVDSLDIEIGRNTSPGILSGGAASTGTISGRPVMTIPQVLNICTKIDVDPNDLNDPYGEILEDDESNNVDCHAIRVLEPRRDLVVAPGSLALEPSPLDPSGLFRAGLPVKVTYDLLNQGIGAVRVPHRNGVRLNGDPNLLCYVDTSGVQSGLPLVGGAFVTQSYGQGTGSSSNLCKIPFEHPAGPTTLSIVLDTGGTVDEKDPNGNVSPAEANNTLQVPLDVAPPLDPEFRIQQRRNFPDDHVVEIFGPGTETMLVGIASARSMASYAFTLNWGPPELISLGDPNQPGGDPNRVEFLPFLEEGGLVQSCAVTFIDNAAGRAGMACTTADPGGGLPGVTEFSEPLVRLTWTAQLPGRGSFTITDLEGTDVSGQPFNALRIINGAFVVSGIPELSLINPVPPQGAYPGLAFNSDYEIANNGFGVASLPVIAEVILSRNGVLEYGTPESPDFRICAEAELAPVPGKTTLSRSTGSCLIKEDIRPGLYTGFYKIQSVFDPNRGSSAIIPVLPRAVALHTSGNGRLAETFALPGQPGGSSGPALGRARRFAAGSLAAVKSVSRNQNWLLRLLRSKHGKRRIEILEFPLGPADRPEALRTLNVPGNDRKLLGGADIDGDGDDELIILQREGRQGDRLDFRRVDFTKLFPLVCLSAAETPIFPERILGATGIQFDSDPEEEVAVVTGDGALAVYDLDISGTLPPASPCDAVPTVLLPPATADLILLASDPSFTAQGEKVLALCAPDHGLDGVEEILSLVKTGKKSQALRLHEAPAGPGGTAVLLADDPAFGGSKGRGRMLDMSCTR